MVQIKCHSKKKSCGGNLKCKKLRKVIILQEVVVITIQEMFTVYKCRVKTIFGNSELFKIMDGLQQKNFTVPNSVIYSYGRNDNKSKRNS